MCLAIVKPKGIEVPEGHLWEAGIGNPDGFGLAYADGKTIQTVKTMDLDRFVLEIVPKYAKFDCLIHFRWATHGSVGLKNCHPFFTRDGENHLAMIHNGVIPDIPTRKDESDTRALARSLKTLERGWTRNDAFLSELGKRINGSKLAFMTAQGQTVIVNESLGHWDKGIWYSNRGYKPYKSVYNLSDYFYKSEPVKVCSGSGNDWEDAQWADEPWDENDLEFYRELERYEAEKEQEKRQAKKAWKSKQKVQIVQTTGRGFDEY